MDWIAFATKVPVIIKSAVEVVDHIRGARGPDKKQAVLDSVPTSIELAEFAAGRNLLNDAAVRQLLSAVIDAEAAALKARNALRDGLLAKAEVIERTVPFSSGTGTDATPR